MRRAAGFLPALGVYLFMLLMERSVYPLLYGAAVLIHECAHLGVAKLFGAQTESIFATAAGLCIRYRSGTLSYGRELLISLSGAAANLLSALAVLACFGGNDPAPFFFAVCSLSLAAVNLLPVRSLDGGDALRCLLLMRFSPASAERFIRALSLLCSILLWAASVYVQIALGGNLSLFLISVSLFWGAVREDFDTA